MKNTISTVLTAIFLSNSVVAQTDLTSLAHNYFDAWSATQKPNANRQNLEAYLALLTDDVGHQHLPYDPESVRKPGNKNKMLEGMNFYLDSHTEYSAKLNQVITGHNLVVIKYSTVSAGTHPQTKKVIEQQYDTVEVLEIEDDKVAVIRKYSE